MTVLAGPSSKPNILGSSHLAAMNITAKCDEVITVN